MIKSCQVRVDEVEKILGEMTRNWIMHKCAFITEFIAGR